MTVDQWQDEVERLENISRPKAGSGAKGFSSSDLAKQKGIDPGTASHLIKRGIEAGILRYSGRQQRTNMIGVVQGIPVYEFIKPAKKR